MNQLTKLMSVLLRKLTIKICLTVAILLASLYSQASFALSCYTRDELRNRGPSFEYMRWLSRREPYSESCEEFGLTPKTDGFDACVRELNEIHYTLFLKYFEKIRMSDQYYSLIFKPYTNIVEAKIIDTSYSGEDYIPGVISLKLETIEVFWGSNIKTFSITELGKLYPRADLGGFYKNFVGKTVILLGKESAGLCTDGIIEILELPRLEQKKLREFFRVSSPEKK